jgi:hypothetical protein
MAGALEGSNSDDLHIQMVDVVQRPARASLDKFVEGDVDFGQPSGDRGLDVRRRANDRRARSERQDDFLLNLSVLVYLDHFDAEDDAALEIQTPIERQTAPEEPLQSSRNVNVCGVCEVKIIWEEIPIALDEAGVSLSDEYEAAFRRRSVGRALAAAAAAARSCDV